LDSSGWLSQPHFEGVWRWHSHSRNGDLWVLRDSRKLRVRLQGSKHLALRCYLYHWKGLEVYMSKMLHVSHLDIYNTSYGWKKGRESNCQFNSRPIKVGNRPDPGVCRWSVTHHWKALKEGYKFSLDFIPIKGLSKELWTPKFSGVQTETISGPLLGSPEKKCHSVPQANAENTMWGKVLASPEFGLWWVMWVKGRPWLVLALKVLPNEN
jgi:hypothetical protein